MSVGDRGKWAEGKFRKWAKDRSDSRFDFAFLRYPDARAGSFAVAPCDFEATQAGKGYKIEIKEVDHAFRLPCKNFSPDKVARLRKFEMAGDAAWVLIHFAPLKKWRIETVGFFMNPTGASWDMSHLKLMTFDEAVAEIFGA